MGKIRAPYYRIVVADSRTKRDGRVIEEIGKYHPKEDPSFIEVDSERAQYWLGVGAQPSEPVAAILKVTGDWQKFRGEPAPAPMLQPEQKQDRQSRFNEALKDSRFEPTAEAVTPRRTRRSEGEAAAEEPAADQAPEPTAQAGAESPAEQAAAPDEPVEGGAPAGDAESAEASEQTES
jgi:small subunit ribosomal protein S16